MYCLSVGNFPIQVDTVALSQSSIKQDVNVLQVPPYRPPKMNSKANFQSSLSTLTKVRLPQHESESRRQSLSHCAGELKT